MKIFLALWMATMGTFLQEVLIDSSKGSGQYLHHCQRTDPEQRRKVKVRLSDVV